MAVVVLQGASYAVVTNWSSWFAHQWAMNNMDLIAELLIEVMRRQNSTSDRGSSGSEHLFAPAR